MDERSTKFEPPLQQHVIQQSTAAKETSVPPLQNRGDATSSLKSPVYKKTDLQKSAVQQSAGPKGTGSKNRRDDVSLPVNCSASSTRAKRKFNERDIALAKSVVVHPRKEETGIGNHVKVLKSSEELKETDTKSAKAVVVPPRKEELNIGKHNEVPESSGKLEKTNTKSVYFDCLDLPKSSEVLKETDTKSAKAVVMPPRKELNIGKHNEVPESSGKLEETNAKSGADVEAGRSDAGEPHLARVLPISEEDNPYLPTYLFHWRGSFLLPNGHEKFNDDFKAHLPAKVHYKVYETVRKSA